MSITIEADELPILLEEINNEVEVVSIGIWLQGIAFCFLISLLGLEVLIPIKEFKEFKINFWRWVVLGLVMILARLVSYLMVKFVLYLLKLNRFCRVKILFFVIEEKNTLRWCWWSVMVFFAGYFLMYHPVMDLSDVPSQSVVWFLLIFMIGCFTWLVMSILLKLHKTTRLNQIYFERVRKAILEQCIIRMLMSSSPERQNYEISLFNDLSQLNKKDTTARIVDKLMDMVEDRSLPSVEVVVTKSILRNIIELSSSSNHVEQIKKFLSEQSALIINFFEEDGINENALHLWVVAVYKDRRTLLSDIRKTNIAITNQHLVVRIGVVVIFVINFAFIISQLIKNAKKGKNNSNEFTQFDHSL